MSGLPLPSQWVANTGNSGLQLKIQSLDVCVRVCVRVHAHMHLLSHVQLFEAPWTVAYQAPVPMEFSRKDYWSGLPFLTPGDLPDPWIRPASLVSPALAGGFFTPSTTWEAPFLF